MNRTLSVREWDDRIVFLRRVIAGSADKSYGLHVARLAGLPTSVIARAGEVLANLERQEYDPAGVPRRAEGASAPDTARPDDQLSLFAGAGDAIARRLRDVDLDSMTPIEALNLLAELKRSP